MVFHAHAYERQSGRSSPHSFLPKSSTSPSSLNNADFAAAAGSITSGTCASTCLVGACSAIGGDFGFGAGSTIGVGFGADAGCCTCTRAVGSGARGGATFGAAGGAKGGAVTVALCTLGTFGADGAYNTFPPALPNGMIFVPVIVGIRRETMSS